MNCLRLSVGLCLLELLVAPGLAQAMIEGRVTLAKTAGGMIVNQRYEIVTKAGVVATIPPLAIVYLEGDFTPPATPPLAQIAQKGLAFQPVLLPVRVGTRVEFPNFDDAYHNIFSYSEPKRFDLGRYRPDERPIPSQVFDVPGLVTLRCDIHEHMRALVLVLATPHFTVTDPEGRFRLEGLPRGHYVLKVWLNSRTTLERPVDLDAATVLRADFP